MNQLGAGEQVCRTVRAGSNAGTATNASGVVQRVLGGLVVDVHGIGIRCGAGIHGYVTALLHHVVQCGAVNHHVLNDGVRSGAEGLQLDGVAIVEVEQALLAGRGVLTRAVWATVDGQTTGTADALAAVRSESERFFAALNIAFVDVVQ